MGKRRNLIPLQIDADHWLGPAGLCGGRKPYYKAKEAQTAAQKARARTGHMNLRHFECKAPGRKHFHVGHTKFQDRNGQPTAQGESQ